MEKLLQHAASLAPSDRLLLASRLIQSVRDEMPKSKIKVKWEDALGLLNYPALGEDAQMYISRSRRADDQQRYLSIRDGE
jgi:hypothetical protein